MKSLSYIILIVSTLNAASHSNANTPNWSNSAELPGDKICYDSHGHKVCLSDGNRANIYGLSELEQDEYITNGAKHALFYPVSVTELQMPYKSMQKFFNSDTNSPLRRFIYKIAKDASRFKDFDSLFAWMGLNKYPASIAENGPNRIPNMGSIMNDRMGITIHHKKNKGMTVSCAACHSSNLFGTKVLGMTNRFPRANEFFKLGQVVIKSTPASVFKSLFKADKSEMIVFKKSKNAMKFVGLKKPLALGLDTSLAQVGLSLAKRGKDEYALRKKRIARNPRYNKLKHVAADSKPAVWWNLKFKTRWLSDGSIVSGNPVHTNFLWNEIGRGIDLKDLEGWLLNNQKTVRELTSFVFASKAPKYNDFFPSSIDIHLAKKGQKRFLQNCSGCHGKYEKAWDISDSNISEHLSYPEMLSTTKVWYHTKTPVIKIGTDPLRHQGMGYFAKDLNRLKISKTLGAVVVPQKGYVPPPLVGIWARWPYFHNNSVPTLYDVLTPDVKRPKTYISVPAQDKNLDFDTVKNGYPAKENIRAPWKTDKKHFFNTKTPGLRNMGHTKWILIDQNGKEKFDHQAKLEIIEFLKTL